MPTLSENDIVSRLHELAQVEPPEAATDRAVSHIRTALATVPARRRSVYRPVILLSGAIAASLAILGVCLFSWLTPRANAAGEFQKITEINRAYQGWVKVTTRRNDQKTCVSYYNLGLGVFASINFNDRQEPSMYEYANLVGGERWTYVSGSNDIHATSVPPSELERFVARRVETLRIDRLLDLVTQNVPEGALDVYKIRQGDWDRYDFDWLRASSDTHTAVFVDPQTSLVMKTITRSGSTTLDYEYDYQAQEVADIYALGVPEGKNVVDLRGTEPVDPAIAYGAAPLPTDRPALYGRKELLLIAEAARNAIHDLDVTFTANLKTPHPHNLMSLFRARVISKGEKVYIEREYAQSTESTPFARTVSYNGECTTLYEIKRGLAIISNGQNRESQTQGLLFFDMNLLNPSEGRAPHDQSLLSLLSSRKARIRDFLELVRGRLCHVIDTREVSVWLDAERSCVPLRQVYHNPLNENRAQMVFLAEQTTEAAPGIWFVTRGRKIVSPCIGVPELTGMYERQLEVEGSGEDLAIRVNTGVDDTFFDLWQNLPDDVSVVDMTAK